MKIKVSPLKIPQENPFENDVLGRKESAEVLTQLISTIDEPFVLAIDSPWGTGKTTFLRMWMQHLKNEGYPCLLFNAWENDFSEDPLASLIGEIDESIEDILTGAEKKSEAKEIFKRTKEIGATLIKSSLPAVIKIATSGLIDTEKIQEAVADSLEEFTSKEIEKYEEAKNTIKKFKEKLNEFVECFKTEGKPIIFFIDELDRCRPNYAIKLLEKIKHLFDIKGIIFVLAIDKEQIGYSIESLYGKGMNADGYLRRFIDLDYTLPSSSFESFGKTLYKKFNFEEFFKNRTYRSLQYEEKQLFETLTNLFKIFDFSLRVQEQCYSRLSIIFKTVPFDMEIYPILTGALIALKARNPQLYRGFIEGKKSYIDVINFVKGFPKALTFFEEGYGTPLEAHLAICSSDYREARELIAKYGNAAQNTDSFSKENHLLQIMNDLYNHDSYGRLSYISKKIEITENFK